MKFLTGFAALAALAWTAGCGSSTTTVSTPEGKASVTTDASGNSKTTVETDKGKMTAESSDGKMHVESTDEHGKTSTADIGTKVDPSELGIELYPGSTAPEGQAADAKFESGGETVIQIHRTTADAPEKVADFYKKLVKDPATSTAGGTAIVGGKTASGDDFAMSATKDPEKPVTNIAITVHKKKK